MERKKKQGGNWKNGGKLRWEQKIDPNNNEKIDYLIFMCMFAYI